MSENDPQAMMQLAYDKGYEGGLTDALQFAETQIEKIQSYIAALNAKYRPEENSVEYAIQTSSANGYFRCAESMRLGIAEALEKLATENAKGSMQ